MPRLLGRDPALLLGVIAALVKLIAAFGVHVTPEQQGWINFTAAAVVGVIVAFLVHDGQVPALLGAAQAAMSLAVAFGLHWSTGMQATVMGFAAVVLAFATRTQVSPPVRQPLPALTGRSRGPRSAA